MRHKIGVLLGDGKAWIPWVIFDDFFSKIFETLKEQKK
jgi:NAD dependent epimerase/dehydratase family enzyme